MSDQDPIVLRKTTIKIEGDRDLHNYTFDLPGEPAAPVPPPIVKEPAEEGHPLTDVE